jgi:cobalt-zinc-cadmium efflux system membrane fusion protein
MRRRTRRGAWLLSAMLVGGCGPGVEPVPADDPPAETEAAVVAETRWTGVTELFMEYPPLVANQTSRFAIHLTDLETFAAVDVGRVVVTLDGGVAAEVVTDAPSTPGIFGVDVTPDTPGTYRLRVQLDSASLHDVHDLGMVTVYPDVGSVVTPPDEDAGAISFLKEQQWVLDFATREAAEREILDSLVVPGTVHPRTGGEVQVGAPVRGRVATGNRSPVIGESVRAGQTLAEILPLSGNIGDRVSLELSVAEAVAVLKLTRTERDRTGRLVDVGALPERRHTEAESALATATARLEAARARLEHLTRTLSGEGEAVRETRVQIRAPIGGVLASVQVTPGATVEVGEALFRIVAVDEIYVVGMVPEAALPRLRDVTGAELDAPGLRTPVTLDRLVSMGRVVDPATRTVPIVYARANLESPLAIGQSVTLRVFTSGSQQGITVPETAVVDDGGQTVVFVQTGGESFTRRAVRLGTRAGGFVQIVDGVEAGERFVSRGAGLIRLAALSPSAPTHGHVH